MQVKITLRADATDKASKSFSDDLGHSVYNEDVGSESLDEWVALVGVRITYTVCCSLCGAPSVGKACPNTELVEVFESRGGEFQVRAGLYGK